MKRSADELRKVKITRNFTNYAEGSVLYEQGNTRVLCNVSVSDGVPPFLRGTGKGWLTAEYALLPRSTSTRVARESVKGKRGGRTVEISRLVGRALRAALDLEAIGEYTLQVDCDVIQADGGTRCASITGAMIALADALAWMNKNGKLDKDTEPLRHMVAAVSVGIIGKTPTLDLCYEQDSTAAVDMNFVMTDSGRYVEVQGTAEGETFSDRQFSQMRKLAAKGIKDLIAAQAKSLKK